MTQIEERIISLIGVRCHTGEFESKVLNYEIDGDIFNIKYAINNEVLQTSISFGEVKGFLKQFEPLDLVSSGPRINLPETKNKTALPEFVKKHNDVFSTLTDGLIKDLDRVRSDKTYIDQAVQASKTTQTIINIARQELETWVAINNH